MHRSSQSMAALASALAKAQTGLVNPEKTMTAAVREDRRGEGTERSFRYATLASGLDLVRKALGQHEIAVMQTTAMDEPTRTVRLNTVLAHSSGEWIASDWPVCPISDMASPKRMGAALTYARRYSLFTLVGIAGEDDLDAPDLNVANAEPVTTETSVAASIAAASQHTSGNVSGRARGHRMPATVHRPILAPDESARLRQGMLAEIESIGSSEAATVWANTMLRKKNTLTADDARSVELAFESKFAGLVADPPDDPIASEQMPPVTSSEKKDTGLDGSIAEPPAAGADTRRGRKLPITKTVRHRNKEHLQFVRAQRCLICAKQPSDPHHLPFAQPRALGRKVSDEYAVPLCRAHHRELHRAGKEIAWWQSRGIAPLAVAEALWQKSQSGKALNDQIGSPEKSPANHGVGP
jgi:hypothetical protein